MARRDIVGDFVMSLYDSPGIPGSREMKMITVHTKFQAYLRKNQSCDILRKGLSIDSILTNSKFILKNKNGNFYKFDFDALYAYRNKIMAMLDEKQIQEANNIVNDNFSSTRIKPKVLEDFSVEKVVYRFGTRQKVIENFTFLSRGCYCCQLNFQSDEDYLMHVDSHMQESNFEYPNKVQDELLCEKYSVLLSVESLNNLNNITKIFVFKCGSIYNLDFEKVVDVDAKSVVAIYNAYINWNIFEVAREHPITVVFQRRNEAANVRYLEEHHFLRFDSFPASIHLKSKNNLVRNELKIQIDLPDYKPSVIAEKLHVSNFNAYEHSVDPKVRDYLQNKEPLNRYNIYYVFKLLVEMEDYALCEAYENLKLENIYVQMDSLDKYFIKIAKLSDSNLLEDILSIGDQVVLKPKSNPYSYANQNSKRTSSYYCSIVKVISDRVYFEVRAKRFSIKILYDVNFEPQRLKFKYQHRALEFLNKNELLKRRLFPMKEVIDQSMNTRLTYFNEQIADNPEHREAVTNILGNTNKHLPFILFGPPGTGKTTVIVETILQIYKESNFNRVLVAAGSNAACDEVAGRLCKFLKNSETKAGNTMLRIYAASYEKNVPNINEEVLKASNFMYGDHYYPALEVVYTYPIVITTFTVIGRLVHGGMSGTHFTHVFLEECGASTEPESLMAVAGVLSDSSNFILCGDPKQLGPIVQSKKAASYGLERSLLDRLLSRECYLPHPETKHYNHSIQIRLLRNYRSHAAILSLPNQLYYNSELHAYASIEITNFALNWPKLRNKTFPIIFKSVYGVMRKQENCTSWYNNEELNTVMIYVKELMYFGIKGKKLNQKDIGIISPYKKQYQFLRKRLDERGWFQISTGSVENFQGQERPVIIVSTVRSKVKTPGFLDNPKRLNVLMTRAQSLLIIIGNPNTLYSIGDWRKVIEYCKDNRAIIGLNNQPRDSINDIEKDAIKDIQNQAINGVDEKENRHKKTNKSDVWRKMKKESVKIVPNTANVKTKLFEKSPNVKTSPEEKQNENSKANTSAIPSLNDLEIKLDYLQRVLSFNEARLQSQSQSPLRSQRSINFPTSSEESNDMHGSQCQSARNDIGSRSDFSTENGTSMQKNRNLYPEATLRRLQVESIYEHSPIDVSQVASAPPMALEESHFVAPKTYARQPPYNPAFHPKPQCKKESVLKKCVIM